MGEREGTRYECGCVQGYYWCAAHDIYTAGSTKALADRVPVKREDATDAA